MRRARKPALNRMRACPIRACVRRNNDYFFCDVKSHSFDFVPVAIAVAFSLFGLSSCSTEVLTPQERAQVIEQLEQARQTDLDDARDTSLGPTAQGDYIAQAEKADSAIRDLKEHSNVPKAEISEALFVPPRHLSPQMRAQLVEQLKQARALDDEKWRNNLGSEDEAWLTLLCDIQARRATRVIKKLEAGEPVSWYEINDAMTTPDEIP